nr:AraC family transcriptional regulator [Raoultella sp. NCTC 9187]
MNSIMQSAGSSHYSTVGVAESRRFEYWNDVCVASLHSGRQCAHGRGRL